jgi:hypothetical protein
MQQAVGRERPNLNNINSGFTPNARLFGTYNFNKP